MRRWALYAARRVRPREEMVTAMLAERRREGIAAPAQLAALADPALQFAESALALKPDTSPYDLAKKQVADWG